MSGISELVIHGKTYEVEFDAEDPFCAEGLRVAFCDQLAADFTPIIFDHKTHGSKPYPPDFVAYRLTIDPEKQKLCALFEVYWRKQDCSWRELNKDHDHDYEQVQVHFDLGSGEIEKVVVSSVGPVENAGHGVEVYSPLSASTVRTVEYTTSNKNFFPWGGKSGQKNITQIREIPLDRLLFEGTRPAVLVLNCYHVFSGLKRQLHPEERKELQPTLKRMNRQLLDEWYYRHNKNRFGHDISKPFEEPYIMYYPPPEDLPSRFAYGFLWIIQRLKRIIC